MANIANVDVKPVIVLAFDNNQKDSTSQEVKALTDLLKSRTDYEVVDKTFARPHSLLSVLEQYKNRIAILYFAGSADSSVWKIDGGSIYAKGLISFFKNQYSTKLLFLAGCNNPAQIANFKELDVPALITTGPLENKQSEPFTHHFYEHLINKDANFSLLEAYKKAEENIRAITGKLDKSGWACNLYCKEDSTTAWKLSDATNDPLIGIPPLPKRKLPANPFCANSWFTASHAEVFFGRNKQIADFYRFLTKPDGFSINLLYGQSQVGKTSFLLAGTLPKLRAVGYEAYYYRVNQTENILPALHKVLNGKNGQLNGGISLKDAWYKLEKAKRKPLLVVVDQLEQPLISQHTKELAEFMQALQETFAGGSKHPKGKLILSFNKEWLAEITDFLEQQGLSYNKLMLKPLSRQELIEATCGITKHHRLQTHYKLSFIAEENLPTMIVDNLLSSDSAPASKLQMLLSKMWEAAQAENSNEPKFSKDLYQHLVKKSNLRTSFSKQKQDLGKFFKGLLNNLKSLREKPILIFVTLLALALMLLASNYLTNTLNNKIQSANRAKESNANLTNLLNSPKLSLIENPSDNSSVETAALLAVQAMKIREDGKNIDRDSVIIAHPDWVTNVAFSPNGQQIVSGSLDGTVRLWDVKTQKMIGKPWQGHRGNRRIALAFSPSGQRIVSGSEDTTIRLWDVKTGKNIKTWQGNSGAIWGIEFSSDSKQIVSGGTSGAVNLWDAETEQAIGQPWQGHSDAVNDVAFSPDSQKVVSCGVNEKFLRLWDVKTGEMIGEPWELPDRAYSVDFSPDGKLLISGNADFTLTLWDVEAGKMIGEPWQGHVSAVRSVAFSPDSKQVVSGSGDTTARLWDVKTGNNIGRVLTHGEPVWDVAFSPNGQQVASAGVDGKIRLWSVNTSETTSKLWQGLSDELINVTATSNGHWVVSNGLNEPNSNWQDLLIIWDVNANSWLEGLCSVAGRNFTRAEWQFYLGDRPYEITCTQHPTGK